MSNQVITGLGASRIQKDSDKDLYWRPELLIPGSGVLFTLVDLTTKAELEGAMSDASGRMMYPQASQTLTGLKITTTASGYTGDVVVSGSVTLTVVNGLITTVA